MIKSAHILVVDDNKNVLSALRILLENYFEKVTLLSSPNRILSVLRESAPDVVLLDMNFSAGINTGNEGFFWLSEIKKAIPDLPVVLFTAYADIELAVRGLKEGASDFIVKPWENAKLVATLQAACNLSRSRKEMVSTGKSKKNSREETSGRTVTYWGESPAMVQLHRLIEKVAGTDANILITGENGTGKEVIAREIHRLSLRKDKPLVPVDMGSISESLFESELFGHVKGAFTDAKADREGKFESADQETLFLDEIGNLNLPLQSKLLTVLQSRQIVRVGSNKYIPVDIRLICATNSNLEEAAQSGRFREDLLYRINTIHLEIPPLRNRKEDIPGMAEFFLLRYADKYGKAGIKFNSGTLEKLKNYHWPGNVRELQHAIEKAVILSEGNELLPGDFYIRHTNIQPGLPDVMSLEEAEKLLIGQSIRKHDGNLSAVAAELGITRPTLYSKIKKYGL